MADAKMLKKVPVREQDPKVRATNFEEVCLGYNQEEAMEEAQRCLGCKKPKCVEGCPVSINIPGFIEHIKDGNIEEAYKVIGLSSALPAICGRLFTGNANIIGVIAAVIVLAAIIYMLVRPYKEATKLTTKVEM